MPDLKISQLTEDLSPPATAEIALNVGGSTFKAQLANLPISGTGDVVGPASSEDNEVVIYDGLTGKLVKRSNYLVDFQVSNGERLVDSAISYLVNVAALPAQPTITIPNAFPAGSAVKAVTVRVVTALNTGNPSDPTGFDIGDATDVDAYGANIGVTAGVTTDLSDYTIASSYFIYDVNTDLLLTALGNDFNSKGSIRVTIFLQSVTPATS